MTYGVTIRTLDRTGGNGTTMLLVDAPNPLVAESRARSIAQDRYRCEVAVDHAVPCPGLEPSADHLIAH